MGIKKIFITILLLFLCGSSLLAAKKTSYPTGHAKTANATQLVGLYATTIDNKSRLIFFFSHAVSYQIKPSSNPKEIIIDLNNTEVATDLNHPALINTNVASISTTRMDPQTLRLILNTKRPLVFKTSPCIKSRLHYHMLMDLWPMEQVVPAASLRPPSATEAISTQRRVIPNTDKLPLQKKDTNTIATSTHFLPKKAGEHISNITPPIRSAENIIYLKNNSVATSIAPSKTTKKNIVEKSNVAVLAAALMPSLSSPKNNTRRENNVTIKPANNQNVDHDNYVSDVISTQDSAPGANIDKHTNLRPKLTALDSPFKRNIMIVIDPGHGGEDSGAIGITGLKEKHIVLAISKYLQAEINATRGFEAILTRDDDYFISLRERLHLAHKHKADMFIAIHADAYPRLAARGASVFALSSRGASSELARWVADKENESELGHTIADKNLGVKAVLLNLAQSLSIENSRHIGTNILQNLSEITDLHSHQVEQAAFVVLKSPDIPSLLVESGFLSNPYEEHRLNNPRYQEKLAKYIARGITDYFRMNPPFGRYARN